MYACHGRQSGYPRIAVLIDMTRPMRILTITGLYPNAQQPLHGIFVENRLRQLACTSPIEARVVAPVPWFPFASELFGKYGQLARVSPIETRHGLTISHPRFLQIPKLGMSLAPLSLYMSLRHHVGQAL